ncbi:ECF-type sigma factor [Aliikangiella sp. IMCC44359]|uniref:ECF-type sigma factor n=1 Tax=Aliikangiella sp. IMCC44359 TaxID=3459125 RepID=UPI00403AA020
MFEESTKQPSSFQVAQQNSLDHLYPIIYKELHQIAHRQLNNAWGVDTVCTTDLVSEAYLKLIHLKMDQINDKKHFFAIAATAMRQIIINYAEKKRSLKRGGNWQKTTLAELAIVKEQEIETLILINKALKDLSKIDKDLCQLVELKFFAGLNESEISELFQISTRTVRRNWTKAKALLSKIMS